MSPLYEDLDAAALDLGAEVDAEHGQLDAVRAERLHVPVVHEAGQTSQMTHKVICKIMQNLFKKRPKNDQPKCLQLFFKINITLNSRASGGASDVI